ncbi:hypothetical protein SAMN05444336_105171 [Albimonas donghaensis]|uniref:Uncharacterized protein n=1 Tax=Albimonas donghaensis TaxID=356660 RepID=A0A1H3BW24_9RHOB|nr:DUF6212 domain-containing protein [Albimonas donghaensis]SDX45828.1 hypothetical protein SAMN05444336_105171 [Albimonas donghaensis]
MTLTAPLILAPRALDDAALTGLAAPLRRASVEAWVDALDRLMGETPASESGAEPASEGDALAGDEDIAALLLPPGARGPAVKRARDWADKLAIPVYEGDAPFGPEFDRWLTGTLLERAATARRDAAQSRAAAALLREETETLQSAFAELESFAYALGAPNFSTVASIPATGMPLVLEQSRARAVVQHIPSDLRGLVAVDLNILNNRAKGAQTLRLMLRDRNGTVFARTDPIACAGLKTGWTRFNFGTAVEVASRDAELVIELDPRGEKGGVWFALGPAAPAERLRAAGPDGAPLADAPLALRAYRGTPGARLPRLMGEPEGATGASLLMPRDAPRPRRLLTESEDGSPGVKFWPKENAILVHPPAKGCTFGVIKKVAVENLVGVDAMVNVQNPHAPAINFALGAAPSSDSSARDPMDVIGDWITLGPRQWGEAHAWWDKPITGEVDLILATSIARGEPSDTCWALFRAFRLHTAD